jgi:hypothetical protein
MAAWCTTTRHARQVERCGGKGMPGVQRSSMYVRWKSVWKNKCLMHNDPARVSGGMVCE